MRYVKADESCQALHLTLTPHVRWLPLPFKIFEIQPFIFPTTSALVQAPIISCLGFFPRHWRDHLPHPCFSVAYFPSGWPESKKIPAQERKRVSLSGKQVIHPISRFMNLDVESLRKCIPHTASCYFMWGYQPETDPGSRAKTISDPTSGKHQDTKKGSKSFFKEYNQFNSEGMLQDNLLKC